jgi:aryl sulfotransferase
MAMRLAAARQRGAADEQDRTFGRVEKERRRYQTSLEDSTRWDGFELRPDDIVISAPSKSGTTWTQMVCALLIFQTPDLPAPLTTLSPWLDMRIRSVEEVHAQLAAQQHRRFIKTHTPLDGVPTHPGVTYLAVGRDPRDVAVSLHHQSHNLDRGVIATLLGEQPPEPTPANAAPPDERSTFLAWLANDDSPVKNLDSPSRGRGGTSPASSYCTTVTCRVTWTGRCAGSLTGSGFR